MLPVSSTDAKKHPMLSWQRLKLLKAALDVDRQIYDQEFQNVQRVVEEAEKEIAKQKALFLTRKYTRVTKLLKSATDIAKEIAVDAPKARKHCRSGKGKSGVDQSMLNETENDLKKASKLKSKKSLVPV